MPLLIPFLLFLSFCVGSEIQAAESELSAFEAHYGLYGLGLRLGESTRRLEPLDAQQWRFHAHNQTSGVAALLRDDQIEESSDWHWREGRPEPLRYYYRHLGSTTQREVEIEFDWLTRQALHHIQDKPPWRLALQPGVLDKLLYQLALMYDLQQGKRGDFEYRIADGGRLKAYRLIFVGEEVLQTELGELRTLHYRRQATRKTRTQHFWLAEKLAYLPVRMEYSEANGDTVLMKLEAIQGLGWTEKTRQ